LLLTVWGNLKVHQSKPSHTPNRKEKRLENKRRNYWSATWYENGKMMQRCEYYGSCEFPCNGDC